MTSLTLRNIAFLASVSSPSFSYDIDAQTIITAIETADAASLETTVKNAINTFVLGCKTDSIWTILSSGVFRFLAGPRTLSGVLKAGFGADPTNVGFVSGDFTRSTGIQFGGTKYLNSNRNNNADPQNDQAVTAYMSSLGSSSGTYVGMGVANGTSSLRELGARSRNTTIYIYSPVATGQFFGQSRDNSANYIIRTDSTNTTFNQASQNTLAGNLFVGAANSSGSPVAPSDGRCAFYSIGPSLGGTGMASLESRITTYIASISGI